MYGLLQDVSDVVGNDDDAACDAGMAQYDVPMFAAIQSGITSGTLDGIAGPRKWRIVYLPGRHNPWQPDNAVPVEANRTYGGPMSRDDSLAVSVVNSILDGEDPKRVLRQVGKSDRSGPPGVMITTPNWMLRVPIYTTAQGRFSNYGYVGTNLTPEQKRFLDNGWEEIEFNVAEGDTHGPIHDFWSDHTGDRTPVVGRWKAYGDWDNMPYGKLSAQGFNPVGGGGEMVPGDPEA